MPRRGTPTEDSLKRACERELKKRGVVYRERHGIVYAVAGDPDLYFAICGKHYEVELKRPGEEPTDLQSARLAEWGRAGVVRHVFPLYRSQESAASFEARLKTASRRIRISERVHAGLAKARKQGRIGGRPRLVLSHAKVMALSQEGCTIREIAEEMGVSPASIHRILNAHQPSVGDLVVV